MKFGTRMHLMQTILALTVFCQTATAKYIVVAPDIEGFDPAGRLEGIVRGIPADGTPFDSPEWDKISLPPNVDLVGIGDYFERSSNDPHNIRILLIYTQLLKRYGGKDPRVQAILGNRDTAFLPLVGLYELHGVFSQMNWVRSQDRSIISEALGNLPLGLVEAHVQVLMKSGESSVSSLAEMLKKNPEIKQYVSTLGEFLKTVAERSQDTERANALQTEIEHALFNQMRSTQEWGPVQERLVQAWALYKNLPKFTEDLAKEIARHEKQPDQQVKAEKGAEFLWKQCGSNNNKELRALLEAGAFYLNPAPGLHLTHGGLTAEMIHYHGGFPARMNSILANIFSRFRVRKENITERQGVNTAYGITEAEELDAQRYKVIDSDGRETVARTESVTNPSSSGRPQKAWADGAETIHAFDIERALDPSLASPDRMTISGSGHTPISELPTSVVSKKFDKVDITNWLDTSYYADKKKHRTQLSFFNDQSRTWVTVSEFTYNNEPGYVIFGYSRTDGISDYTGRIVRLTPESGAANVAGYFVSADEVANIHRLSKNPIADCATAENLFRILRAQELNGNVRYLLLNRKTDTKVTYELATRDQLVRAKQLDSVVKPAETKDVLENIRQTTRRAEGLGIEVSTAQTVRETIAKVERLIGDRPMGDFMAAAGSFNVDGTASAREIGRTMAETLDPNVVITSAGTGFGEYLIMDAFVDRARELGKKFTIIGVSSANFAALPFHPGLTHLVVTAVQDSAVVSRVRHYIVAKNPQRNFGIVVGGAGFIGRALEFDFKTQRPSGLVLYTGTDVEKRNADGEIIPSASRSFAPRFQNAGIGVTFGGSGRGNIKNELKAILGKRGRPTTTAPVSDQKEKSGSAAGKCSMLFR